MIIDSDLQQDSTATVIYFSQMITSLMARN